MKDSFKFKVTNWHIIFENEKGIHYSGNDMVNTNLLNEKDMEYLDEIIGNLVTERGLWNG
jgi:hypothetical protein